MSMKQFNEELLSTDWRRNRPQKFGFRMTDQKTIHKHQRLLPPELVKGKTILDIGSYISQTGDWCLNHGATKYTGVEIIKEFANKYNVPVRVLSSFNEGSGTLITLEEESMENALISGIAFQKDQVKFTLHGVGDIPGTAFKILGPISDAEVEVDVIVQNVSVDGKTDFTFTVPYEDQETVIKIIDSIKDEVKFKQMMVDSDIAKVSLVGVGMRSQAGVASRAFKALSENEVNIQIICTSEIKLTMVIDKNLTDKAVKILHEEFDLEN